MQNPAIPARGPGRLFRGRSRALPRDAAATTKRNRWIFGLASLLALVGSYFGIIKPETQRLQEARGQAEEAERQVAELTRQLAHLRDLERRSAELGDQAIRLNEALPVETHLARFILQVQEASIQAKMDWVSASPTPPVASGAAPGLMESSIAMSASGTYASVQDFLGRLENLQRAVKIGSVNLSLAGESVQDPNAKLNMTLNMKMFVAPTSPPLPSEPIPPGGAPAPARASAAPASPPAAPQGTG